MIVQTAPSDTPRLAIMMFEHTALCLQFAHAFGNVGGLVITTGSAINNVYCAWAVCGGLPESCA